MKRKLTATLMLATLVMLIGCTRAYKFEETEREHILAIENAVFRTGLNHAQETIRRLERELAELAKEDEER